MTPTRARKRSLGEPPRFVRARSAMPGIRHPMKLVCVAAMAIATALVALPTHADQYKIGVMNVEKILRQSKAAQAAQARIEQEFKARDAQLLGVSVDSEFVHLAWRRDREELKALPFPMFADIKRELAGSLGVLDPEAGVAQRATYIVDPQGVIRFVYVTDLSVGRSPEEVLRVLDALQTDELCPCNWQRGDETLKAA